tara:strand:+ start:1052 stop:1225 length:174 start_codon:yes stop_codon:yes gene_type:complete
MRSKDKTVSTGPTHQIVGTVVASCTREFTGNLNSLYSKKLTVPAGLAASEFYQLNIG